MAHYLDGRASLLFGTHTPCPDGGRVYFPEGARLYDRCGHDGAGAVDSGP
jgi:calcineurin-like phosphoesterase